MKSTITASRGCGAAFVLGATLEVLDEVFTFIIPDERADDLRTIDVGNVRSKSVNASAMVF